MGVMATPYSGYSNLVGQTPPQFPLTSALTGGVPAANGLNFSGLADMISGRGTSGYALPSVIPDVVGGAVAGIPNPTMGVPAAGGVGPLAGGYVAGGAAGVHGPASGTTQPTGIGTAGYINAGLAGLQTLGNLWMGMKQMKLAKQSFNFSKDMAETNLANSMKTYNSALADRSRSRGFTEGQSQAQIDAYTKDNSLTRRTG